MSDYVIQFADWCEFPPETMVGETVFDGEGNAIGWIVNATVGRDIERYNGSGRRGTVAILQGGRKPEEVLFVREDGVTHYLPEDATVGAGTCHTVAMDCFGNPPYNQSGLNGNSTACGCSECGAPWSTTGLFRGNRLKHNFKACPICGARIVEVSE